jgi:hypothetical protein
MSHTASPAKRIDVLLNTLVGERYVRRPLLSELVDELTRMNERPEAVRAGKALIARIDSGVDEVDYEHDLERVIELTCPEWYRLAAE